MSEYIVLYNYSSNRCCSLYCRGGSLQLLQENDNTGERGRKTMKVKKMMRAFLGANIMLIMTFTFLPVLIFNPDLEILNTFSNYLNKD